MADRDAPVVTTVSAAIREVMGIDPDYVVSPGTYDQKHIDRIGRLRNCIAYGPAFSSWRTSRTNGSASQT